MAHQQFMLSEVNPNDSTGGGGCICDENAQTDCKAPFVVCYQNTMDSAVSPHVVACASCINEMHRLVSDSSSERAVVGNRGDSAYPSYVSPYAEDLPDVPKPSAFDLEDDDIVI